VNGVHDMGGMDGFGKVEAEPNEPMFHTRWESRVLAMVRAMGAAGAFNIDTSRFYRESLPPHVYLASSYYKKWFLGLEDMLIARGFIGRAEVAEGHALEPAKTLKRGKFTVDQVERVMVRGKFGRDAQAPAKFKAGDRVRAKTSTPSPTRVCHAMCAAISAWSSAITASRYFRTRRRQMPATTRNGFTPSCSTGPSCGARKATLV
jgi:nitrile hydratase beta subunit